MARHDDNTILVGQVLCMYGLIYFKYKLFSLLLINIFFLQKKSFFFIIKKITLSYSLVLLCFGSNTPTNFYVLLICEGVLIVCVKHSLANYSMWSNARSATSIESFLVEAVCLLQNSVLIIDRKLKFNNIRIDFDKNTFCMEYALQKSMLKI